MGHAAKAGSEDEGTIEDQIRTQKANKKGNQAQKIHDTAASHSPAKSKLKNIKNNLKGMTKEGIEIMDADGNVFAEVIDLVKPEPMTGWKQQVMAELSEENQSYFQEVLDLKKAPMGDVVKDFYKSDAPQFKGKSKKKRQQMAIAAKLQAEENIEEAAWTKKEGQNKNGGLNEKGRKSYERENPGSDLKAPSKKVGNKRRKLHSALE